MEGIAWGWKCYPLCKKFQLCLSLVAVGFLVFAGGFVFRVAKAKVSLGPLIVESSREWYNLSDSYVSSVFVDDVDDDGVKEIITGGFYSNSTDGRDYGLLRIWNLTGTTLTLERSQQWYTGYHTYVFSVFVGDVDGDGVKEIITGGRACNETYSYIGQLRVWNWDGLTLTLEASQEWYTIGQTYVNSVFVDDIDGDGVKEIITGGDASDFTRGTGQLRIWNWDGTTLTLEVTQQWYTEGLPVSHTYVNSIFVDDVDGDGVKEIITGGYICGRMADVSYGQLRVWALPLVDSLNINIDAGMTHFRGEIAEFYVLTSYRGTPINPTQTAATLYCPDGTTTSLTPAQVATGLHKISYTLPIDAPTGTYTLTVEASYQTNAKDLKGITLKSFQLSSTLTQWNAWLLAIQQDTATVKTDIGLIKLNLTAINANLTAINGNIATINTNIGTIKADVATINAKITSIDGNIATIETDVGTIKADISTIDTESIPSLIDTQTSQGTTLYVTTAISALAAAGALGTLALILRKRKLT